MKTLNRALLIAAATLAASPLAAQDIPGGGVAPVDTTAPPVAAPTAAVTVGSPAAGGIGQFEAPKQALEFNGLAMQIGGAFAQTFQALDHENTATPAARTVLGEIRPGFSLANANLNIGVQLARGIRVDLESYMASRHHNEFWVKGGFATIDASPFDVPVLNRIMEFTTIRAGHFEINYGDAHFRRTDNGNAIRNPFVENYILDAFTTEIGAEVMLRGPMGSFVLAGVTTGENKGNIKDGAVDASPAFLGKLGFDRQFTDALRLRLTGSVYTAESSPAVTLYGGDRTGSHYWGVMEDSATLRQGTAFTNGRINPGFANEIRALQLNPYVELGNLELFGVIERASGKTAAETERREVNQLAGDVVYRLLDDQLYLGARYNRVNGDFAGQKDLEVRRTAVSAGWFLTRNLLTKVEYVTQEYDGFAATDIRNGGRFNGFLVEGVIAF
jgi:acetyltransferase-like isoleucine patch superfamily enzyme